MVANGGAIDIVERQLAPMFHFVPIGFGTLALLVPSVVKCGQVVRHYEVTVTK